MRRARLGDNSDKMSLFPFLAVLVCTMGALLVLLVVIARGAMAEAEQSVADDLEQRTAEAAPAADAVSPEEAATAREQLEQRIETLQTAREQTERQRGELRQALGDLEDHMAQLIERLRTARAAHETLAAGESSASIEQLQREIAATQDAINQTKQELAAAQAKAAEQRRSYAIIPYDGPSGTQREPIYLECLPDAVVIQPFGIRLNEEDFSGDLDQNNPLAAGLRAAAGFLARQQNEVGRTSEPPYPLLIVRPSGIRAYYAARAAMGAWTSDFGYELVDDDWPLEFAAGDPRLGDAMLEAVELARRRRAFAAANGTGGRYGRSGSGGDEAGGRFGGDSPFGGNSATQSEQQGAGRASSGTAGDRSGGGSGSQYNPSEGRPPGPRPTAGGYEGNQPSDGSNPTPGELENTGGGRDANANNPGRENHTTGALNTDAKPIAEARGENWAELGASRGSTAITRPVALVIAADRVTILTHVRAATGKTINMPGDTRDSIDEFVNAVWDHMRGWGIAGRGLYWKPIITAQVAPGGELRAAELRKLLENSGMEIEFSR